MAKKTPKLARGGVIGGTARVTLGREGCEQVVPLHRDAATARSARDAAQTARSARDAAWPPPVEVDEDAFVPTAGDDVWRAVYKGADEDAKEAARFDRGAMWIVLLITATASALVGAVLERLWG